MRGAAQGPLWGQRRTFEAARPISAVLVQADILTGFSLVRSGANNGHRKPLHLRLRGSEFNDGDQSNQNEDGQHSGLRDREG